MPNPQTSSTQQDKLQDYLDRLQQVLQRHALWQSHAPSQTMLASQLPFMLDTLSPVEWLQWVFIPRMRECLIHQQPLPKALEISPYFAEALHFSPSVNAEILAITTLIDSFFSTTSLGR